MSNKEQLDIIVSAVMEIAEKGKIPFFTEEGIAKLGELMKDGGRGFIIDFREVVSPTSININEVKPYDSDYQIIENQ